MMKALLTLTVAALTVPLVVIILLSMGNCYYSKNGSIKMSEENIFFLGIATGGGAVFAILGFILWSFGAITLAMPEVTRHYKFWSALSILCLAWLYGDLLYLISSHIRHFEETRIEGGSLNGRRRRRRRRKK